MGILDFDLSKITGNDAFMLGMGILGNNQGHYGALGPALGGGLQDYQRQKYLNVENGFKKQQYQQMQEEWARQEEQRKRLQGVRDSMPDNPFAQIDPAGYLKHKAEMEGTAAKSLADKQWQMYIEKFKSDLNNSIGAASDERKFNYDQYGNPYGPQGSPSASQGSNLTQGSNLPFSTQQKLAEVEAQKAIESKQKSMDDWSANAIDRRGAIDKAKYFLNAFKGVDAQGNPVSPMNSGMARSALSWLPTFTDQGRFDEEFNAFAEVAARQKLKQSGETRPTDADVEGMKRAMFGIGRDEQVNIKLLEDYIRSLEAEEGKFGNSGVISIKRIE